MTEKKKPTPLKQLWATKETFSTQKFELLSCEVEIRELSGLEKNRIQEEENMMEKSRLLYEYGVVSPELKLTHEEFNHAYNTSHKEIDYICDRVIAFSFLTSAKQGELEKN